MHITALSGTRTVGAVQLLIQTDDSAVILDFGVVGNPRIVRDRTLFNEFSPPRPHRELQEYLWAGMAPPVIGIYAPQALPLTDREIISARPTITSQRDVSPIDLTDRHRAVFISHAHDDHMHLISYLDPRVPIVMSEAGREFHRALIASGSAQPTLSPPIGLAPGEHFTVGDLTLTAVPVDHDIPGASGVIVTGPSGARLAYTGDWRRHGRHPELMDDFAAAVRGVDLLITEASTTDHTAASLAAQLPESAIGERVAAAVAATPGTVYITFHHGNSDRHAVLREIAAASGRTLVVTRATARLWQEYDGIGDAAAPLRVWSSDRPGDPSDTDPGISYVDPEQIRRAPDRWICEMPVRLLPLLFDTGADGAASYVMSNGHPYSPGSPHWSVLRTWVRELGLRWFDISSQGHAFPQDLAWLVEQVRPRAVLPVHTNRPEGFPPVTSTVLTMHDGARHDLS